MEPNNSKMLTCKDRKDTMVHLVFLDNNRYSYIKVIGCIDVIKQIFHNTKEKPSIPTFQHNCYYYPATYANAIRYVSTCDIPGDFVQAYVGGLVHFRVTGPLARLLTKLDAKIYYK